VISNWFFHTTGFRRGEFEVPTEVLLFEELVLRKTLPFDFRPWEEVTSPASQRNSVIRFGWAISENHVPLLDVVIQDEGFESIREYMVEAEDWFLGKTPVGTLVDKRMLQRLQDQDPGPSTNSEARWLYKQLLSACKEGHAEVFKALFARFGTKAAGLIAAPAPLSHLLLEASSHGNDALLSEVLPFLALYTGELIFNPEEREERRRLRREARGKADLATLGEIQGRVNVGPRFRVAPWATYLVDGMESNAIEIAALNGFESTVGLLASYSCQASAVFRKTVVLPHRHLQKAARVGNTAVIKCLLFLLEIEGRGSIEERESEVDSNGKLPQSLDKIRTEKDALLYEYKLSAMLGAATNGHEAVLYALFDSRISAIEDDSTSIGDRLVALIFAHHGGHMGLVQTLESSMSLGDDPALGLRRYSLGSLSTLSTLSYATSLMNAPSNLLTPFVIENCLHYSIDILLDASVTVTQDDVRWLLLEAIENERLDRLQKLCECGLDLRFSYPTSIQKFESKVYELRTLGFQLDLELVPQITPIIWAILCGSCKIGERILIAEALGGKPSYETYPPYDICPSYTLLELAIIMDSVEFVNLLIRFHADVKVCGSGHPSLLHFTIAQNESPNRWRIMGIIVDQDLEYWQSEVPWIVSKIWDREDENIELSLGAGTTSAVKTSVVELSEEQKVSRLCSD
jgi:ankyrin repeat protein